MILKCKFYLYVFKKSCLYFKRPLQENKQVASNYVAQKLQKGGEEDPSVEAPWLRQIDFSDNFIKWLQEILLATLAFIFVQLK